MITNIVKKIDQLNIDTTTNDHVNILKDPIKRLEHGVKSKRTKDELCSKYSKYTKLVELIDLMEITRNQYESADYWISFHYEIKFGDLITLSRAGIGPYDEILAPTLYIAKTSDNSSSDNESIEEYDNEQYDKANAKTIEKLYEILERKVSKKRLEEFIEDMFKAI